MSNDNIQCGCGAKINSANIELLSKFDVVHGNADHQKLIMTLKLAKVEAMNVQPR